MNKKTMSGLVAIVLVIVGCRLAWAEDVPKDDDSKTQEIRSLPWQKGPGPGKVGDKATIAIPSGGSFLDESKGSRFLELLGNLPSPGTTILAFGNWFATLNFSDSGYIKDDEKLDPDALLAQLKGQDEEANAERKKRSIPQLYTDSWAVPPHYDAETKHLEWGLNLRVEGQSEPVVNYTVRLLGRSGFETVVLVSSPKELDAGVKELKKVLGGFDFVGGQRYAEFRQGDRVAEIGLGALIVGGAAAAVVKTGYWKTILAALVAGWKFVAAGIAAVFYGAKKMIGRGKSGGMDS